MALYFIADLHLQQSHPRITQGFLQLLQRLDDATALYIVGDLFEVWVGDDYSDECTQAVIAGLNAFSASGKALYFMHGNRDFLLGEQFCEQTGGALLDEPHVLELHKPALLLHGDSLCTKDTAYMQMRTLLRNPQFQQQLLVKPLAERLQLAVKIRGQSQAGNQLKAEDIMDVTPSAVDALMDEHQVSILIHGHTHRPNRHLWQHKQRTCERIVLGDWHDDLGWVLRYADGLFEQTSFAF